MAFGAAQVEHRSPARYLLRGDAFQAAIMAESSSWPTSDVPLEQRVRSQLDANGSAAFRSVDVAADKGVVTLTGAAASFFAKQLAQEFSRRVPGVSNVINLIEVTE